MRMVYPLVNQKTVANGADENVDFSVPAWAIGAIFFFQATGLAGTTPLLDLKFQHAFIPGTTFKDVVGASIVQLAANADILMTIDPRITAAANVQIACALSSSMRAVIVTDFTTGNETYTYSLAVEFYS